MSTQAQPASPRAVAALPVVLVGIVLLMVAPVPPFLLDLLLALSIGISLVLLLVSLQVQRVLDLSSFPSVLLFSTLLRLALNVASTRLVLLHGGEGPGAAGNIIRAFGEFMIGGNYVVGATVFLILIIINFQVITKGAGRVAEVAARFALDSMPGKQMAIDADLAAGLIDQNEARLRRKTVEQESDFFGAMDGASKFVRGDAIAGLLITGINIVVGFIVGMLQHNLPAAESAATYAVLAIGDGLASQIPALLVSTAAAVVVTRASAGSELSPALVRQVGQRRSALTIAAWMLGGLGFLPGMPLFPFLALAGAVGFAARAALADIPDPSDVTRVPGETQPLTEREKLEQMLPVELIELEVGYDLVQLVDASQGGELVERIAAIRRNLASELGIIIPAVHIRDNLRLRPGAYRLLLSGQEIGKSELRPTRLLAMDPTGSAKPLPGSESVREPAFGLPAQWIVQADRETAETNGYTVVDPATVAATHLTELLRAAASELFGRGEAQELVDLFARREPKLVDELIPNLLPLGEVIKVLRLLLKESVSIRDLRTIFETLCDHARDSKDPQILAELVRARLSRQITARFAGDDGRVAALVLDPRAEEIFRHGFPDATSSQKLLGSLDAVARGFAGVSTPPVLICAADVRRSVGEFFARRVPGLWVLSYRELDSKATLRTLGVVTT